MDVLLVVPFMACELMVSLGQPEAQFPAMLRTTGPESTTNWPSLEKLRLLMAYVPAERWTTSTLSMVIFPYAPGARVYTFAVLLSVVDASAIAIEVTLPVPSRP